MPNVIVAAVRRDYAGWSRVVARWSDGATAVQNQLMIARSLAQGSTRPRSRDT